MPPKWRERLAALHNIPPLIRMVMKAARGVVLISLAARLLAGLLPLGMLAVTRFIIDSINLMGTRRQPLPGIFRWIVPLEFGLATLAMMLGRLVNFCDAVLADKYAAYINTRIIDHASRLDLATYEDAEFHVKLERARIQGTERIGMIQSAGKLVQQFVTAISLVAGIWVFSPWVVLILVVCLIPGFIGETHFAFRSYSLVHKQTPTRREMDYLRVVGGSRESVKKLELFQLRPFLIERYSRLASQIHRQTKRLA